MNGTELSNLIEERLSHLRELTDIGNQQMAAIQSGRMSELMGLLSKKQAPLSRLADVTSKIRMAASDDPNSRIWENEQARATCRTQQEECEKLHLDLLAMEAACETALKESRASIEQKIDRVDSGRQAAVSYADSEAEPNRGAKLDLSSD